MKKPKEKMLLMAKFPRTLNVVMAVIRFFKKVRSLIRGENVKK